MFKVNSKDTRTTPAGMMTLNMILTVLLLLDVVLRRIRVHVELENRQLENVTFDKSSHLNVSCEIKNDNNLQKNIYNVVFSVNLET